MATLRTATPATNAMKSVLPRFIAPAEIAQNAACIAFAVMEPRFLTGTGTVSQVANLARPDEPFIQATTANQPSRAYDAALGRETLSFNSDRIQHLNRLGAADYTGSFSLMTVAKVARTDVVMNLIGDYGDNLSTASIHLNSTATFRARVGSGQAVFFGSVEPNMWYATMASYGGTGRVKSKRLDGAISTGGSDVATEPTTTALRIGHPAANNGIHGAVDMAAMFSVDILAPAHADLLSRVETMLKQYYGAAVVGGA